MFRPYIFSEIGYPYAPPDEMIESHRVSLPNKYYDPDAGHQIYNLIFDIWQAADDLGLDIQINEHHQTTTCLDSVGPLPLAILSRITKKARLLTLGNPAGLRTDPVRIAEEMAMCDVISGGRVDVGLIKGAPSEISAVNGNPVDIKQRLFEAADLIKKAWTTHDGPFNWEGEYFHHRQVNIWPRPFQQPHPEIWTSALSPGSVPAFAERGWSVGTLFNGYDGCKAIFDSYRGYNAEHGLAAPAREKLGYACWVYVADTDEEAYDGLRKLRKYVQYNKVPGYFSNPPGYNDVRVRAMMMQKQRNAANPAPTADVGFGANRLDPAKLITAPSEQLIDGGFAFAGTPDSVFEQLKTFYNAVGGFGNLIMQAHVGTMSMQICMSSMERFARDVLPRFREEVYNDDPNWTAAPAAPATQLIGA